MDKRQAKRLACMIVAQAMTTPGPLSQLAADDLARVSDGLAELQAELRRRAGVDGARRWHPGQLSLVED